MLGLFGDPAVTGKSRLDDLREGKRTLLVVRALRLGDRPAAAAILAAALGDPDLDEEGAARGAATSWPASGALASVEALIAAAPRRRASRAVGRPARPHGRASRSSACAAVRGRCRRRP